MYFLALHQTFPPLFIVVIYLKLVSVLSYILKNNEVLKEFQMKVGL